jgi:hypothetical protein
MELELTSASAELPRDRVGRVIREGDTVVCSRTVNQGGSTTLEIRKVTRVDGPRVFLDGSRNPIRLLDKIAVVDPVVR